MLLRPLLNDAGSCASYLFGCTTHHKLAVAIVAALTAASGLAVIATSWQSRPSLNPVEGGRRWQATARF